MHFDMLSSENLPYHNTTNTERPSLLSHVIVVQTNDDQFRDAPLSDRTLTSPPSTAVYLLCQ